MLQTTLSCLCAHPHWRSAHAGTGGWMGRRVNRTVGPRGAALAGVQSSAQNEPCRRRAGDGRRSWGMCAVEYKNRRAVQASSRGVVSLCMAVRARWHPWQPLQMLLPIPWAPRTRFEAALGNGALAEESMFARIFPASLFVFDPVRCTHSPVTGEHESRLLDFSHLDCACVRPNVPIVSAGPCVFNRSRSPAPVLYTCRCPPLSQFSTFQFDFTSVSGPTYSVSGQVQPLDVAQSNSVMSWQCNSRWAAARFIVHLSWKAVYERSHRGSQVFSSEVKWSCCAARRHGERPRATGRYGKGTGVTKGGGASTACPDSHYSNTGQYGCDTVQSLPLVRVICPASSVQRREVHRLSQSRGAPDARARVPVAWAGPS